VGYAAARRSDQQHDSPGGEPRRARGDRGYEVQDSLDDPRDSRAFDLEAQRRQRRLFIGLMSGFAVLAVLAGALLANWIIDPLEQPKLAPRKPTPVPDDAPVVVVGGEWEDEEEEPPEPPPGEPTLKASLDAKDLNRGMARLRAALDACARQHGAIDGTQIAVDFTVAPGGRVTSSSARPPFSSTGLGKCVAGVVSSRGKFRRTRNGLADIHRLVTLHRPDL